MDDFGFLRKIRDAILQLGQAIKNGNMVPTPDELLQMDHAMQESTLCKCVFSDSRFLMCVYRSAWFRLVV